MTDTSKTIILDQPIKRGEQTITEITLRKPSAGELRGCNLADLMQMDVNALIKLLPRISTPTLTENDVIHMDTADLLQTGVEVTHFLLSKEKKKEFLPT
ncbi:MAG: phage tail assembly protein [Fluviibacter sp.]